MKGCNSKVIRIDTFAQGCVVEEEQEEKVNDSNLLKIHKPFICIKPRALNFALFISVFDHKCF